MSEYAGRVCRHVCHQCGGCDNCCAGHERESGPLTFDRHAFREAVEDAKGARRVGWAEVARQAGIADDTIRNFTMGRSLSLDTIIRLLAWMGETDLKPFIRSRYRT